jgi:general secretion pathway protein F
MPRFQYTARTRTGEKTDGVMDAPDRRTVLQKIQAGGSVPVSVTEEGASEAAKPAPAKAPAARSSAPAKSGGGSAAASAASALRKRFHFTPPVRKKRFKTAELLIFSRELADLLSSGMKLSQALGTLARRGDTGEEHPLIADLRDSINRGLSMSDALAQYPDSFPSLYVSMIQAGEASGTQTEVLERLVTHYERIQEVKEKVSMALVYPAIVLLMGMGTLIFSMVFVIPRFAVIFEELKGTLPLPTKILIGFSTLCKSYGLVIIAFLVIGVLLFRRYLQTEKGKLWWNETQLKLPLIRGIVKASAFAQFARTLSTLLTNGVPVLTALSIVERIIGNAVLAREIHNAREKVTDGTTISKPLAAGGVFPPMITDMLAVGEQTGDVSGSLLHIANRYERELDRSIKVFTTLLEPIMIVVIAALVGFVAISMLMAVFEMTSGLGA